MKYILWLFLIKVISCHILVNTYNQKSRHKRITNGTEVTESAFPWMAGLFTTSIEGPKFCGGVLISREFVLTSAFCVYHVLEVGIVLGAYNIKDYNEPGQIRMRSREVIIHKDWDPIYFAHDIALVRLPKPVPYSATIKPIIIWQVEDDNWINVPANITGWGKRSSEATMSDVLIYTETKIRKDEICMNEYKKFFNPEYHFCVGGSENKEMCPGDEGGPLSYYSPWKGDVFLIGVSSYGFAQACSEHEGTMYPSVYTQVYKYKEWIEYYILS